MKRFADILAQNAKNHATKQSFTFVNDKGEAESITFNELDRNSDEIASALVRICETGDRVVLLLPQDINYIKTFVGCLKTDIISVPLFPPRQNQKADRVNNVIEDCKPRIVLTSTTLVEDLKTLYPDCSVMDVDTLLGRDRKCEDPVTARVKTMDEVAFLQYTSGSTGRPKGVMVTQTNIVANLIALEEAAKVTDKDIFCNWLPLFHDLGLIVTMLLPIYLGAHSVIMTPPHFIRRPLDWLTKIHEYRATVAGCPNFAFEHCYEKLNDDEISELDLSCWRIAFNAAEPIKSTTLRNFSDRFSAVGFNKNAIFPCYGMAEATVFIAAPEPQKNTVESTFNAQLLESGIAEYASCDESEEASHLIGCGKVKTDHDLVILDTETDQVLKEGFVGQICFAGPSVAKGYWADEEKTRSCFNINIPESSLPFLKTGDLGFIKDDMLYISSRMKDLMIVNGRNLYPQDFESTVYNNFDFIRNNGLAAFEKDGKCYMVLEVDRLHQKNLNYEESFERICELVFSEFEVLLQDIVFIKSGRLNKTSSGKVQRAKIKDRYFRSEIDCIASLISITKQSSDTNEGFKSETQRIIHEVWSKALGTKNIGIRQSFYTLGGQSITAINILNEIESRLKVKVGLSEMFRYTTIEALSEYIDSSSKVREPLPTVESNSAALTSIQQNILFSCEKGAYSDYNLTFAYKLKGVINEKLLEQAFAQIVQHHPMLRTCLKRESDKLSQVVSESTNFNLEYQQEEQDSNEILLNAIVLEMSDYEFDLYQEPALKVRMVSFSDSSNLLVVTLHHLFADGWSGRIITSELSEIYNALCCQKKPSLASLPNTYLDFCEYQSHQFNSDSFKSDIDLQLARLENVSSLNRLPDSLMNNSLMSSSTKTHDKRELVCSEIDWLISPELRKNLQDFAQTQNTSVFSILNAGVAVLLHKYSGKDDVVWGMPAANRENSNLASITGCFVNTLVARQQINNQWSLLDLVSSVKKEMNSIQEFQHVPFEHLVRKLFNNRPKDCNPLVQILIVQEYLEPLNLNGIMASSYPTPVKSEFDLTLRVSTSSEGVEGIKWQYNSSLFTGTAVERLIAGFEKILNLFVESASQRISELSLISDEEIKTLSEWNNTDVSLKEEAIVLNDFARQVELAPEKEAVVYKDNSLSYSELDASSNQLAHLLQIENNVLSGDVVAICLERSTEMVACIYGILKSGAAYLPVDPGLPSQRIDYMLSNSNVKAIVSTAKNIKSHKFDGYDIVNLESSEVLERLQSYPETRVVTQREITNNDLAYVIYTSGSTGVPKGVMIEHAALYNRVDWMQKEYLLEQNDRVLQKTPFSFDVSVWEFIWPLMYGATLVVAEPEKHKEPAYLSHIIEKENISVLHFVPSMLSIMFNANQWKNFSTLRYVFCSGEALPISLAKDFVQASPDIALVNLYGPTECAIDVSHFTCKDLYLYKSIPIGKPIQNIRLYVLDKNLSQVPIGVRADLYISGNGLARGYINQEQLTKERFIDNPFYANDQPNSFNKLYQTGDLASWSVDGNIEFHGRNDSQVKLRGFRIELDDIESALTKVNNVDEGVVTVYDNNGDSTLVGYFTSSERSLTADKIRTEISRTLPEYMIPAFIVRLESFPLSHNGKVDRKQLPKPQAESFAAEYEAPEGSVEIQLASLWQEVLQVKEVSRHDNFFKLGGHSMHMMKLIAKAKEKGILLDLETIYSSVTLSDCAASAELISQTQKGDFHKSLITNDVEYITPELLPLTTLNNQDILAIASQVPGGEKNISDIYPLAALQNGIFYHFKLVEDVDPYVTDIELDIQGLGYLSQFFEALNFIISRHDILRTAVVWEGIENPHQVVYKKAELSPQKYILDDSDNLENTFAQLHLQAPQTIDISSAPCLRVHYAQVSDSEHYAVIIKLHHIVDDALSLITSLDEMLAYFSNAQESLAKPVPYSEFVAKEIATDLTQAKMFFNKQLAGINETTAPFELLNIQGDGKQIVEIKHLLQDELVSRITSITKTYKVSKAAFFHAAWSMLISACCGKNDVVFGTVLSGRMTNSTASGTPLGLMINTLPVRENIDGKTAESLLTDMHERLNKLLKFETVPLSIAQQASELEADVPLFSALLNYRHTIDIETVSKQLKELAGTSIRDYKERTNYPFVLSVSEYGESIELDFQIQNTVSVERVRDYMLTTLNSLLLSLEATPTSLVSSLNVLPDDEVTWQVEELNNNNVDLNLDDKIHQLIERQALNNPDKIAVLTQDKQLTYRQLNQSANQLAGYLVSNCDVKVGSFVGLCLERSPAALVSMLAILKSGAAYVPMDPDYPESRLVYMSETAELDLVLTDSRLMNKLDALKSDKLPVDLCMQSSEFLEQPIENISISGLKSVDPCYVVFTSGSTGKPKGVVLAHKGLVNQVHCLATNYQLSNQDKVLQFAPLTFDMSVEEIFGALTQGATLVLRNEEIVYSVSKFWSFCNMHQISVINVPPAFAQEIFQAQHDVAPCIRTVSVGGDKLPLDFVKNWFESQSDMPELFNAYGPTECTVNATITRVSSEYRGEIGRGIANTSLYVMENNRLLPQGVVGELCVGGVGLAIGYHGLPEMNAEKFVAIKIQGKEERVYRTGDLARWTNDGQIEFLGRSDHQVKIRGYRVELGEVETALERLGAVEQAIVIFKDELGGRLIAYVKLKQDVLFDQQAQGRLLEEHLPDYLIPSMFIPLDSFPLSKNGKVDRKRLPDVNDALRSERFVAASTDTQKQLVCIWQKLLELEKISLMDNFYMLGGHSLLVTRLSMIIKNEFQVDLPFKDLLSNLTIECLAELIDIELELRASLMEPDTETDLDSSNNAREAIWTL